MAPLLVVSGPSGCGKSTLAEALRAALAATSFDATVKLIQQDRYFTTPRPTSYWDMENKDTPDAVDMAAIRRDVRAAVASDATLCILEGFLLLHDDELMAAADVPVVPGYTGEDQSPQLLAREAARIGFPLMIKAAHGGGGKGMRVVHALDGFLPALESCQREAKNAFGRDRVLLSKRGELGRVRVALLEDPALQRGDLLARARRRLFRRRRGRDDDGRDGGGGRKVRGAETRLRRRPRRWRLAS